MNTTSPNIKSQKIPVFAMREKTEEKGLQAIAEYKAGKTEEIDNVREALQTLPNNSTINFKYDSALKFGNIRLVDYNRNPFKSIVEFVSHSFVIFVNKMVVYWSIFVHKIMVVF